MLLESPENLLDVLGMIGGIVGEDEDVVEVHDDTNIKEIGEYRVDEVLEGGRGVSEALRNDAPVERTVAGTSRAEERAGSTGNGDTR